MRGVGHVRPNVRPMRTRLKILLVRSKRFSRACQLGLSNHPSIINFFLSWRHLGLHVGTQLSYTCFVPNMDMQHAFMASAHSSGVKVWFRHTFP